MQRFEGRVVEEIGGEHLRVGGGGTTNREGHKKKRPTKRMKIRKSIQPGANSWKGNHSMQRNPTEEAVDSQGGEDEQPPTQ